METQTQPIVIVYNLYSNVYYQQMLSRLQAFRQLLLTMVNFSSRLSPAFLGENELPPLFWPVFWIVLPAVAGVYRPRHPERTVLYRVLFPSFDRFLPDYERRFEEEYGYLRPIVKEVVERYFGLYANAHRGKVRKASRHDLPLLIVEEELRPPPSKGWARWSALTAAAR